MPIRAPCGRSCEARHARCDERVADVLALKISGYGQTFGQKRLHVLGRMDGEVDGAGKQRLLDFLGEQALAAGLQERPVLDAVAGRSYRNDLERFRLQPVRSGERVAHRARLPERQPAAAGADADRLRHCFPGC